MKHNSKRHLLLELLNESVDPLTATELSILAGVQSSRLCHRSRICRALRSRQQKGCARAAAGSAIRGVHPVSQAECRPSARSQDGKERHAEPVSSTHLGRTMSDAVNHPKHYNGHPSGIECIDVVEHMGFNLGNAIKYVWRADLKNDALEDLRKAKWYIEREIAKREKA
jgi:hypothetical protein